MAHPPAYIPSHDFIPDTNIGRVPGNQLNVEFENIEDALGGTQSNLALIQKDDGTLANATVDFPQLSDAVNAALGHGIPIIPTLISAQLFDHRNAAASTKIPSSANFLITSGRFAKGDGGHGQYYRVNSLAHASYGFQSADLSFWEYIPETGGWNAKAAGVVTDDGTDQSANLMNAVLPFQNSNLIPGGGNLSANLLLPPGVMSLAKPIYLTGSGSTAMKIKGQGAFNLGGNVSTTFSWIGSAGYPTMVFVYGANQFEIEEVNFIGTGGSGLVNCVHVTADNLGIGSVTLTGGPYSPGVNTFTTSGAVAPPLQAGSNIALGRGTANFEMVYVTAASGSSFTARSFNTHSAGEFVTGDVYTNNITFKRCTVGCPLPYVDGLSAGIVVGNPVIGSAEAAQIVVDSCALVGAVDFRTVTINIGTSTITDTGHSIKNGTAVQFTDPTFFSTFTGSISGTTLTVSAVSAGSIAINQTIMSPNVAFGTYIVSGTGPTYTVSVSQSVSSQTMQTFDTLPAPLSHSITYYVVNAATNTYQLSATCNAAKVPGSPITLSGVQLGTHQLLLKTAYGFRASSGGNVKNFLLTNCIFEHEQVGIGPGFSGSLEVYYPTSAGMLRAFTEAAGSNNVNITSAEDESSGAYFLLGAAAGLNAQGATLTQNSYQSGLPADGYAVSWGGNVTLIGNTFLNNPPAGTTSYLVAPRVGVSNISAAVPYTVLQPAAICSIGNYYQWSGPSIPTLYDLNGNAPLDFSSPLPAPWRVLQLNDYGDFGQITQKIGDISFTNAYISTFGATAGIAPNSFGILSSFQQTYTIPFTKFQIAAAGIALTLLTIPPHTVITGIVADVTTPFTGTGGITTTLKAGTATTSGTSLLLSFDSTSAPIVRGLSTSHLGLSLAANIPSRLGYVFESTPGSVTGQTQWAGTSGGDTITLSMNSAGQNLDHLTAGSVTVYITYLAFR